MSESCSTEKKPRPNALLWGSVTLVSAGYLSHLAQINYPLEALNIFAHSCYELMNTMALGMALGVLAVGVLNRIPREFIQTLLGRGDSFHGLLRAVFAGLFLDLCSHGILMVGLKLYERGVSLAQVMAFLIASPWNSLSLTFILISLVGWEMTVTFTLLSAVIALVSGYIFMQLVRKKILPENPHLAPELSGYSLRREWKNIWSDFELHPKALLRLSGEGLVGSKSILKWLFFGIVLSAALRSVIEVDQFQTLFGPTLLGLGLSLFLATVIEVCSEGTTPLAADIVQRAGAPGNGFAFLMAGVSTDYTEILAVRETTKSWKIAFFLPLVTLPQIIVLAWWLNQL